MVEINQCVYMCACVCLCGHTCANVCESVRIFDTAIENIRLPILLNVKYLLWMWGSFFFSCLSINIWIVIYLFIVVDSVNIQWQRLKWTEHIFSDDPLIVSGDILISDQILSKSTRNFSNAKPHIAEFIRKSRKFNCSIWLKYLLFNFSR